MPIQVDRQESSDMCRSAMEAPTSGGPSLATATKRICSNWGRVVRGLWSNMWSWWHRRTTDSTSWEAWWRCGTWCLHFTRKTLLKATRVGGARRNFFWAFKTQHSPMPRIRLAHPLCTMQKGTTFKTTTWTHQVSPFACRRWPISPSSPTALHKPRAFTACPAGIGSIRWCTVCRMLALRSSIT